MVVSRKESTDIYRNTLNSCALFTWPVKDWGAIFVGCRNFSPQCKNLFMQPRKKGLWNALQDLIESSPVIDVCISYKIFRIHTVSLKIDTAIKNGLCSIV